MIIRYLKATNQVLAIQSGFLELKEEADKVYYKHPTKGWQVFINDLAKAGYVEYPDQEVNRPTEWNEELEEIVEIPVTLEELKLRDFTPEELQARNNLKRDLWAEIDALRAKVLSLEEARLP